MNVNKAEIKIFTAHEMGCLFDDFLERATADGFRYEGGSKALKVAAADIDALNKIADAEMDEGKFDLEQAKHIKRYIQRAHQIVINLALNAENNILIQKGRVQGLTSAVEATKKFKDDEMKKVATLQEAIAQNKVTHDGDSLVDGAEGPRPVATRPGMTIKEQRLAEQAAEEAAELAMATAVTEPPPAPVEAEPSVEVVEVVEPVPDNVQPIKPKRGRPRKSA